MATHSQKLTITATQPATLSTIIAVVPAARNRVGN